MARMTSTKWLDRTINRTQRVGRTRLQGRQPRLRIEGLEEKVVPTAYTPGNLVILQAGDTSTPSGGNQGNVYLDELTTGGTQVQQALIPNTGAVGGTGNQPLTLDLTAAPGNGALSRTFDGSGLAFGGVDSGLGNGGFPTGQTPTGTANRVNAVVGNDPAAANFVNTTTYGPYYVGDDNRGAVATSTNGPVYAFGHPNQAGSAVSQGVLYFPGPNADGSLQPPGTAGIAPQSGVQVSSQQNIRGAYLGIDANGNERLYWTGAGSTTLGTAGVYTSSVAALPTNTPPGLDTPVVLDPVSNSKVGGMFIADVNQDGVLDKGDRLYLVDDGTVAGAGSGGIFMSTYDPTVWTSAITLNGFTQQAGWSPMVRLAEGVIDAQPNPPGPPSTGNLRGLAGTVLADGTIQLYASEAVDTPGTGNQNSYLLSFLDNSPGAQKILSATHSGTTATIKLSALPASYAIGTWVSVTGVGSGTGVAADVGGFNGVYQITAIDTVNNTFSYTDNNTLTDVTTPQGVTDLWLDSGAVGNAGGTGASGNGLTSPQPAASQIVATLAGGQLGTTKFGTETYRGVAFAPVAATALSNFQVNGASSVTVSPGTNVQFTVHVANPQAGVTLSGLKVTFIDQNTNTVIGQGTINGSGDASFTTTTPLVGNHTVKAFFAGGGAQALAPATGGTVQVIEAGATASTTSLAASIGGLPTTQAAIGRTVTLTATPTTGATGTVSFYNGSVSSANLLGSAVIGAQTAGVAILPVSFSTAGTVSLIAVYNGDNTFAASDNTGSPTTLTIAANATAVITASGTIAVGSTPTYTATFTPTLGTTDGGTVQFFLDGAALGTPQTVSGNTASVTSTALTAGSHLVTLVYTPTTTSPYNPITVTTFSSANFGAANNALIVTAQQAITPGNLIAIQRGDGTVNLGSSGYLTFLVEYNRATGVVVQRIALPNVDSGTTIHALLMSGQNGSEGLSNRSADGRYITLIGYDTPVGQSFVTSTQPGPRNQANNTFPRTIARIDANGNVDTSTAISNVGALPSVPFDPTDAVSLDGNQFWFGSTLATGDSTNNALEYTTLGASSATQVNTNNHGIAAVGLGGTGANALLYALVKGSGELGADLGLTTVGPKGGLPTASVTPLNLPNLEAQYELFFPTTRQPTGFAFLNTANGTTIDPDVVYVADQANGLLKFWKDTTGAHGTPGNWYLGQFGSGTFGQKLVFAGGATGVVASLNVATHTISIAVTGSNVQQANASQIATYSDANGSPPGTAGTGVDQGFTSGNFGTLARVGGAQGAAPPASANGNENFAGLTFAPGAPTTTVISPTTRATYPNNVTFTATVTSTVDTPQGTVSFYNGATLLGTSAFSSNGTFTFTTTSPLPVGENTIKAVYNPGGTSLPVDDPSTGTATQEIDYTPGDLIVHQVGFSSNIASMSVNGTTVTVNTTNPLPFAQNATGLVMTVNGNNGTNVNGTYAITLTGPNSFTYTASLGTPTAGTGGTVSVGSLVGVTATSVATSGGITTVTATTSAASGFSAGQQVTIAGTTGGTNINGNFVLTSASGTSLKYISSGAVAATGFTGATASSVNPLSGNATASYLNDLTVNSTTGTSVQNTVNAVNPPTVIAATTLGGASWNVSNFTATFTTPIANISAASEAGTTVTITTSAAHNLTTGQRVVIAGISPSGYDGTFTITVTDATHFTYAAASGLGTATLNNATATPVMNLQPGQLVTVTGITPSGFNGTYTILSTPSTTTFTVGLLTDPGTYTSGGSALVDQTAFTEGGTATTSGYLTTSADGHNVVVGGNVQSPGNSLTGAQSNVGVLAPDGTFNDSTLMSPLVGSTRAVASTDGSGFWVASSTGLYFVPFGGQTPSAISAAAWSSANGGTATITAPNNYVAGQSVFVTGIGGATGFNTPAAVNGYSTPFIVLSATSSQFTYSLPTQPTGTPTFTGATSQLAPTLVSLEANNPGNFAQAPSTVTIGAGPSGGFPQLIADAGNQFQNNGTPSIDGPFTVGSGLPTTGGQSIGVYGTGTGQNFPNARDRFQNFPSSAQFAVSPDGQTVFVADSRTDGLGGILEYFQAVDNSWVLLGNLQLDNFSITGASEVGNTVTITTSGSSNFFVGESVAINGVSLPSYNGSGNIVTSVSGNTFTFTSTFSGLSSSGPALGGAFATGADGGVRGLAANFSGGNVILYATTSGTSGNRLIEIKGGTLDGSNASFQALPSATAAPGTAFRGVALAPTRPGTTASTTSVSASGNVLTATVTSGATGWVEFFQAGNYIGTALISGTTATLDTSGILPAGTYSVTATYTGNSTFAPSSGNTSLTVSLISTSTTLSFNPTTAATNSPETLTATVHVPAGQNPTGLVTFTNTSTSTTLGFATVNQVIQNQGGLPVITYQAILTVPAGTFTAGTANISAAYAGDSFFGGSTGTGSLSVVNGTTTTVTSSLSNPDATLNQSVTLTATATSPTGTGAFTGTVQFFDNTLPLGAAQTISSGGVATVTVPTSLVQSVTVLGASNATSAGTTTVTITTDAAIPAALVGKTVTVEALNFFAYNGTFTVTAVSGNTFQYVDNAASGAPAIPSAGPPAIAAGGLAIFLNVLTPGLHSISAVYTPSGTTYGLSAGVHQQTVKGQAIATTDIFSERLGDGISSLNTQSPNPALGSIGATNYIDELNPTNNALIQSFILPTADSQMFSAPPTGTTATVNGTTVTLALTSPTDLVVGQKATVAGVSVAADNGDFIVSAVNNTAGSYSVSYTDNNAGIASGTGGTVQGVVHAVVGDGQQSTTGQMTRSGDGGSLFLTAYDNNPLPFGTALPVPTATGSNAVPRSIAKLNSDGSIQTEAFLSNAGTITTGINSTGNFNGVYSPDGNQFYVGGSNGLYYFPSFTQSASLQGSSNSNLLNTSSVNGIESFGGNLYEISGTRIAQVGTGLPTNSVQSVTGVAWASGTATLTLANTTGYAIGSSVQVSGITGTTGTSFNGTFTLTGVTATTISYALATQPTGTPNTTGALVEVLVPITQLPGFPTATNQTEPIPISAGGTDAYFTNLNGGATLNGVNYADTVYVGDRGNSFGLGAITKWSLTSVNVNGITVAGTTATATLANTNLALAVGQSITVTLAGNVPTALNGTFTITPLTTTTFTFTVPSGTGNSTTNGTASAYVEAPNGILYSQSAAQLGYYWLAGSTNGSTVSLYSTYGNGGNGDFGPGLTYGVLDSTGFNKSPGVPITAATWSGGTVTITANNNFQAGNIVDVQGISPTGYNGQFTIVSASATQFTYAVTNNPGTATVTGAIATSVNTVNSVAFEGAGGGFLGSETTRGVALATVPATTTALTLNGLSAATAGGSIETGFAPTATVSVTPASGPVSALNGLPVTITDSSNGAVFNGTLDATGKATITLNTAGSAPLLQTGDNNLVATFPAVSGQFAGSNSGSAQDQKVDSVFKVQTIGGTATSNLVPTSTGYQVTFNAPLNPAGLFAWGAAPSFNLKTGTTNVPGTVVFNDATDTEATFVATGKPNATGGTSVDGLLAAGTNNYTPTLSGTNAHAIVDTNGHVLGSGTSTGGADYNTPFSSPNSATATTVGVPYFTRGWSQPVNLLIGSANTTGLPVFLSVPSGGTAVSASAGSPTNFTLNYNPALLSVSTSGFTFQNGFNGTVSVNQAAGTVTVSLTSGTLAAGSTAVVLDLVATVQSTATFKSKDLLTVTGVTVNGGTAGQGGGAVHLATFVGDTNEDHIVNSADAAAANQFGVGNTAGFAKYQLADPVIVVDMNNDGVGNSADAAAINQFGVGNPVAGIPPLPTGTAPGEGGPDPRMYFVNAVGSPGQTVTVAVDIQAIDAFQYQSDDIGITYDATKLTPSNIRSGDYPGVGASNISTASNTSTPGIIRIGQFFSGTTFPNIPQGTNGDIVLIDFTVNSNAATGTTFLDIAHDAGGTTTDIDNGAAVLSPAPTNATNDANVDGTFSIVPQSAGFTFANANGSQGQQIQVPINLTAGPTGFTYQSDDIAVTYDPNFFSVSTTTGVATGNFAGIGSNISTAFNASTPGIIRIGQFFSGTTFPAIPANTTGPIAIVTFNVLASAPLGTTFLDIAHDAGGTTTDVNNGLLLSPAPTNATNDPGVDGVFNVTVQPNQPPFNKVPSASALGSVVFNPAATPGLQTPTANTVAFTGTNAITVSDSDAQGGVLTTTLGLAGSGPGSGGAAPVGALAATASGAAALSTNGTGPVPITAASWASGVATITLGAAPGYLVGQSVTVSGMTPAGYNGTFRVTAVSGNSFSYALAANPGTASGFGTAASGLGISGNLTDLNATLATLVYTPGPGFYGTASLTVSTSDNGNTGFGGPQTDVRSTSVQVVGLFISEVDLLKGNTTNPSQYVEVYSTVPSFTIPTGEYLVGINGAAGTPAPGVVTDIFNLAGFTTGTNGFLALEEKGEKYTAGGFEVAGGQVLPNSGSGAGFGNGGATTKFGTITGVHTGGTRPTGQLATDILSAAESFLLIQTATAPTTSVNIDPGNTGNPTNQTSAYNNWTVMDSVGILGSASGTHSYGAITFAPTGTAGTTLTGSTVVATGSWTANFVGRIAQNTGYSSADWLASVVTGTPGTGAFNLGTVNSTQFAGMPLNNIGGPNFWAPQMTVAVNDGSSTEHSQVAELTLTFSSPVNIADLASDFVVKDAQGTALSINVTDPNTGVTTVGATGPVPDSGATTLVISFNASGSDTFNFGTTAFTDVFGNTPTVGLNDGNYFLSSKVADISAASNPSVLLDGAHNGVSGSTTSGTGNLNGNGVNEVDEFWRLYGDFLGNRRVDASDSHMFNSAYNANSTAANYLWYADYDVSGLIDSTDRTQLRNRMFTVLNP
jgi:hypothetical protein